MTCVTLRPARLHFNERMSHFDEIYARWQEADAQALAYEVVQRRTRRAQHRRWLARQFRAAADQWYARLRQEVARERLELPRL